MVSALYLFLFLPPILAGIATFAAWQRRKLPGIRALAGVSLVTAIWGITYAFEVLSSDPGMKYFWAVIKYPAVVWIPVLISIFFLRYSGHRDLLKPRLVIIFSIIPAAVMLLALTNSMHGLFWKQLYIAQYPGYTIQEVVNGPAFWLFLLYSYGLILASGSAALSQFSRMLIMDHNPIWLVVLVMLLPPAFNLLAISGLHVFPGLDPTPFAFGVSSILFVFFSKRRYNMLTPVTLAHSTLLDQMREGVIVFDNDLNVLEVNHAAQRMHNVTHHQVVRKPVEILGLQAATVIRTQIQRGTLPVETQIDHPEGPRWFEVQVTPLKTLEGSTAGYMSVWHEITDRKQVESDLRHASTHDQLTGLYNRQYFEEHLLKGQYDRLWPISVLMIDLDDLKHTNDNYGHAVGDDLIRRTAEVLHSTLRQKDIVARIGGDEFAALLGGCPEEQAGQVVARLNEALAQHNRKTDQPPIRLSIGFTVALYEDELQQALKLADARMYEEKSRHRKSPLNPPS